MKANRDSVASALHRKANKEDLVNELKKTAQLEDLKNMLKAIENKVPFEEFGKL